MRINSLIYRFFYGLAFVALLASCSSAEKNSDTAEGAFAIAKEFDEQERYEEAIRRYQEVRNKFPYSRFASMSHLAIADAYYKQESFAEAQITYQSFKDLHPRHAQIDYVTFRLGLSYYQQLPSTIDRDLTLAHSSMLFFEEVESRFPNSSYAAEAKEKRSSAVNMLASKEEYIADFYFIRKQYDSALTRYEGLARSFGASEFEPKALSRAAISAKRIGELDRAKRLLAELGRKYPESSQFEEARKEVQ